MLYDVPNNNVLGLLKGRILQPYPFVLRVKSGSSISNCILEIIDVSETEGAAICQSPREGRKLNGQGGLLLNPLISFRYPLPSSENLVQRANAAPCNCYCNTQPSRIINDLCVSRNSSFTFAYSDGRFLMNLHLIVIRTAYITWHTSLLHAWLQQTSAYTMSMSLVPAILHLQYQALGRD